MIDCYINPNISDNIQEYEGFPIVNEKQRKTAEKWSGATKPIQIPSILTDVCIDSFDDRLNNKIFKVYTNIKLDGRAIKLYFDMYVQEMLDVMQNSSIEKGKLKCNVVFLDGARLTMQDGAIHKAWLERKEKQAEVKADKKIPAKDLQFGQTYKSTPDGATSIYIGKLDTGGHLVITLYSQYPKDLEKELNKVEYGILSWDDVKIIKTPNYKYKGEYQYSLATMVKYAKLRKLEIDKKIDNVKNRDSYSSYKQEELERESEKLKNNEILEQFLGVEQ